MVLPLITFPRLQYMHAVSYTCMLLLARPYCGLYMYIRTYVSALSDCYVGQLGIKEKKINWPCVFFFLSKRKLLQQSLCICTYICRYVAIVHV